MSDIDEYRTIHEILEEEQRCSTENEKFKSDVERLMRVLSIQSQLSTTNTGKTDSFDIVATNIIEFSNSNFDNMEYLISSMEYVYSYITSSKELDSDDLFSRLCGIAEDIIKMSNMKIYNPMGSYFNQHLRKANFSSSQTKECIEQYAEYNLAEEVRAIAIEIYNQFWNITTASLSSKEIESQIELSQLNNAHNQEMEEWRNSNRRPSNQSEFDIKKYINCFRMEFARQDEEWAECIVMGQARLEAYKEEARRKTEQYRALGQMLAVEKLKEQKTQQEHKQKPKWLSGDAIILPFLALIVILLIILIAQY